MSVHIGSVIKHIYDKREYKISEMANAMKVTENNVYKLFNRESISVEQLTALSVLFNKNLFMEYVAEVDAVLPETIGFPSKYSEIRLAYFDVKNKYDNALKETESLKAKIEMIEKENAFMKELLLKKRQ